MSTTADNPLSIELYDEPGHLIRRAQQIAVSRFHEVHGRHVTPIQYAILRTLHETPGIDQVTLAQLIALDTSTTADIAARLEAKGWILREVLPRRQRRHSLRRNLGRRHTSQLRVNLRCRRNTRRVGLCRL